MSGAFVSRDTVKRLARDVASISKSPLPGIHYAHSETDMLSAYALMIGRENTPYSGGYYFFKVTYPSDYPNSPPTCKFLTNNDIHVESISMLMANMLVCLEHVARGPMVRLSNHIIHASFCEWCFKRGTIVQRAWHTRILLSGPISTQLRL